ncbi:hypothetical protein BO71DRAFT_443522 [Aspergillus ellipticus CBS 707.79]|uniref:P-loop containing nucleoside triphosphate hydrolase protein n=1 Tax=Aspergillus ellipticus CBS 707.79 TaxID=1448320 RepID=A0A319D0C7_9EURO|nr:hypothetical protein BO71DRAFT_443522 [Aspergillus ellipticus CBS 707.79]
MAGSFECTGSCTHLVCLSNLPLLVSCLVSLLTAAVAFLRRPPAYHQAASDDPSLLLQPPQSTPLSPRRRLVEALGLASDISLGTYFLVQSPLADCPLSCAPVVSSAYLLALVAGRASLPRLHLQGHAPGLYLTQWVYTAFVLWLTWVEDADLLTAAAVLYRLTVFTILGLVHGLAPRAPWDSSPNRARQPAADETASGLSRLGFHWVTPLVWQSFRRPLEAVDLRDLHPAQASARVRSWFQARASPAAPLRRRILQAFRGQLLRQGAWATVLSVVVYLPALLIRAIIQSLQARSDDSDNNPPSRLVWSYVAGLLLFGVLAAVTECQCNWIGCQLSARLRAVLLGEIHAKVLRKPIAHIVHPPQPAAKEDEHDAPATDGNILNLVTVDAELVSTMAANVYLVWVVFPVQMALGTYLLHRLLGPSGLLGVLSMLLLLPLNVLVSKQVMAAQREVLAASDARLQASSEVLHNIHAIKYGAWETAFQARVLQRRRAEMQQLRRRYAWWSVSQTLFFSLPFIVTTLTCFFYTLVFGHPLVTDVAFPALAIFNALRIPLNRMADSITFLLQAHVSLGRIAAFLGERDTDKDRQLADRDRFVVGMMDATLAWPSCRPLHEEAEDEDEEDGEEGILLRNAASAFRLDALDIQLRPNGLNVVCGPTGAGKSALLLALLGEMDLRRGRVCSLPCIGTDTAAYCPQDPWILNSSVRDNILLGTPFDARRYAAVLQAVALRPDLRVLDRGDETLAGEHGSRLSGGQRQRVALARALYSSAPYLLLDDSLSALDAHTAQHVFVHGITGPLMQGRTCVFATHHARLAVPSAQHVVLLDGGRVTGQGTVAALVATGLLGPEMLAGDQHSRLPAGDEPERRPRPASFDTDPDSTAPFTPPSGGLGSADHTEGKSEGAVSGASIRPYLGAMGPWWGFWILVGLGFVGQQGVALATSLWFERWARASDAAQPQDAPAAAGYFLAVYSLIGLLYAVATLARDLVVFAGALRGSTATYQALLAAVLHAPLAFFDRTPLGQLTNRFTKDVETVDQALVGFSISAAQLACSLAGVLVLLAALLPGLVLPVLALGLAYAAVTALYLHGARDLKRLEAGARSPVYQHLGDSLAGRVSIRAAALGPRFTTHAHHHLDALTHASLLLGATKEWLALRIGTLSALIVFLAGLFVVRGGGRAPLAPGLAGLLLTSASSITETVMWLVQIYAILQQNLTSLDRILEYTHTTPQERAPPQPPSPAAVPAPTWPPAGAITITNYTTRYAPTLPPALSPLDLRIGAAEFLGVVGRTGAGKSTLALALIRGLEAETGHITLDGVDIADVPLARLRTAITVIPQTPTLFAGTLRDNLAPQQPPASSRAAAAADDGEAEAEAEEMRAAVRTVRLFPDDDAGETLADDDVLDRPAAMLSRGQRQLLALARGLLRRSRVVVLDEPTASVDADADDAVRAVLRALADRGTTVMLIAHRVVSVAACDRVVVVEGGRVVEDGAVGELLGLEQGRFRGLVDEGGEGARVRAVAASRRSGVQL